MKRPLEGWSKSLCPSQSAQTNSTDEQDTTSRHDLVSPMTSFRVCPQTNSKKDSDSLAWGVALADICGNICPSVVP